MAVPIPSMTGGAGGSAGPSTASGGLTGMFNDSGFTVNYAPSTVTGTGGNAGGGSAFGSIPSWVWMAAAVGVVLWMKRKH